MFYTLLVDANASFRQALSDVLLVYFPMIDVEEAGDVKEALCKVETLRPNIVFMDTEFSGANGLELSKEIRQMNNDIVIVILTANNLSENRQQAIQYEADHYISKKEESCMEEILTLIEATMDSRVIRPEH